MPLAYDFVLCDLLSVDFQATLLYQPTSIGLGGSEPSYFDNSAEVHVFAYDYLFNMLIS